MSIVYQSKLNSTNPLPPYLMPIFILGYQSIKAVITCSMSPTLILHCGESQSYTHLWPLLKSKWPWSIRIKVTFFGHPSIRVPFKLLPRPSILFHGVVLQEKFKFTCPLNGNIYTISI